MFNIFFTYLVTLFSNARSKKKKLLCNSSINIKRKWWREMVDIPFCIRPDFKVISVFVCSRRQLSELLQRRTYLSTEKMCGSGIFLLPVLCVDLPSGCYIECSQTFTEERQRSELILRKPYLPLSRWRKTILSHNPLPQEFTVCCFVPAVTLAESL